MGRYEPLALDIWSITTNANAWSAHMQLHGQVRCREERTSSGLVVIRRAVTDRWSRCHLCFLPNGMDDALSILMGTGLADHRERPATWKRDLPMSFARDTVIRCQLGQ